MNKLNLHVLTILGVLIFCVGLINIVPSEEDAFQYSIEVDNKKSDYVLPLLSSAVNYNRNKLILPDIEKEDNFYEIILQNELAPINPIVDNKNEVEKAESIEESKDNSVVSTAVKLVKKKEVKKTKKKDYVEKWAIVTAYCPCARCCGRGSPGITSTGKSAWKPGIAADPKAIPYGTEIYVKGYGRRYVDDTGGAMRRSWRRKGMIHLDIRMTYHYQAVKWGRRVMKIRIYNKKK